MLIPHYRGIKRGCTPVKYLWPTRYDPAGLEVDWTSKADPDHKKVRQSKSRDWYKQYVKEYAWQSNHKVGRSAILGMISLPKGLGIFWTHVWDSCFSFLRSFVPESSSNLVHHICRCCIFWLVLGLLEVWHNWVIWVSLVGELCNLLLLMEEMLHHLGCRKQCKKL